MRSQPAVGRDQKLFAANSKRAPEIAPSAKDLELADVSDMRTSVDDKLHGSGRRVENANEGVTIQITKEADAAGALNMYLYIITDAQLNIEDGRFSSTLY